jgi:hypothetical protein
MKAHFAVPAGILFIAVQAQPQQEEQREAAALDPEYPVSRETSQKRDASGDRRSVWMREAEATHGRNPEIQRGGPRSNVGCLPMVANKSLGNTPG